MLILGPDTWVSLGALGTSLITGAGSWWYNQKSARHTDIEELRAQHSRCEEQLQGLKAAMEQLQAQYNFLLAEDIKRRMNETQHG